MSEPFPNWGELPSVPLGNIYSFLQHQDRLHASLTCRHWRNELFQRRFFKDFKCRLHVDNERQCTFFRYNMYNLTKELTIVFDFLNVFHIEKMRRILFKISRCDNIQGLRFETHSVGLVPPGNISDDNLVDIEHRSFIHPLKLFLARKKASCKVLDLGAIEALTYHSLDLLKMLRNPDDLEQLTLASLKFDPSHYPILTLDSVLLQKFSSLQVLSLDYDTMNESLLQTIQLLPLKKLLICIHGLDRQHPGISERAWSEFSETFKNIDLILTLVYAYEAVEVLQVRILRHNMPITHLRVLFCDFMNPEALEWMSVNNNATLKSVQWIDSAYKQSDKSVMDLFLRAGQDPLVMMSWRCKNLEEIVIHGYVMDPHNIVGISRLRGRALKRLEISLLDDAPSEASMESFIEEINNQLGQKWEPVNPLNLHPALGYMQVSEDVRDAYVFEVMRQDISN